MTGKLQWISQYGSERLKRCVDEGIKHNGIYISERMARDYPGWVLYSDHTGTTIEPINPTPEAFALLDEARLHCPNAKLQWVKGLNCFCAEDNFVNEEGCIINYFGKDVNIDDLENQSDDE